jgi:putative DNA primase/helicase
VTRGSLSAGDANLLLDAALARVQRGDLVLPLWWTDGSGTCACPKGSNCSSPGKHPLTPNGLDDASNDPATITRWWPRWPKANIGERTDNRPRIDIDLLDVAEELARDTALPLETPVVCTPSGGLHIGLATETPVQSRTLYLEDGRKLGELKAARAYVVIPPSAIGGKTYRRLSPNAVLPLRVDDPVEWLRKLLSAFGFALAHDRPGSHRDYEALAGVVHQGEGRHNALVSYAGKVWVEGMAPETLVDLLRVMNERQIRPPIPERELMDIATHFIEGRQQRRDNDHPVMVSHEHAPIHKAFPRTDAGNGELFAHLYGDRVRFDHRRRRWLVWGGHWWSDDNDAEVRRLAKTAVRHRYLLATTIADLNERAAESRFAVASENRQRLDALLAQAQTEPPISDAGEFWDRDPWLLGVANGVVDLRSGILRGGSPQDRITLHSDVPFEPDARCPRWLRFLDEIFGGDQELIDYIWRAVGYSLTGDTSEQCVFTCYGSGANGKSVFLTSLRAVAGSYAYNAPFSTFELEARSSIPNDLAALAGRRQVTASETNEGVRLNEGRLKALTGCDPVTARFLHGEFFTFRPVAKFWLAVNHKPKVTDDSYGFWRRVRLIPFLQQFKGQAEDKNLATHLVKDLPGILIWAVRGAVAWHERGLEPPDAVLNATESYRTESDPLAQFFQEQCILEDGCITAATAAYKAYGAWAVEQGMSERERLTSTAFGRRMADRFEKRHARSGNVYVGVGLLSEIAPAGAR